MFKNIIRFLKAHGIAIAAVLLLSILIKIILHFSLIISFIILLIAYFLIGFAIDIISEKILLNKANRTLKNGSDNGRRNYDNDEEDTGSNALLYEEDDNGEERLYAPGGKNGSGSYIPAARATVQKQGKGLKKLSSDMQSIIAASPEGEEKSDSPETLSRGRRKNAEKVDNFFSRRQNGSISGRTKEHDDYIKGTDYTYSKYAERNSAMAERANRLVKAETEGSNPEIDAAADAIIDTEVQTGIVTGSSVPSAPDPDDDMKIYERSGPAIERSNEELIKEIADSIYKSENPSAARDLTDISPEDSMSDSAGRNDEILPPDNANDIDTAANSAVIAAGIAEAASTDKTDDVNNDAEAAADNVVDNELFFAGPDIPADTELTEDISEQVDKMVHENQRSVIRRFKYKISTDPADLTHQNNSGKRTQKSEKNGAETGDTEVRSHISRDIDLSKTLFGSVGSDDLPDDEYDEEEERDRVVADSTVVNSLFPSRKNEKHKKPSLEEFRKKKENLSDASRNFNDMILSKQTAKTEEKEEKEEKSEDEVNKVDSSVAPAVNISADNSAELREAAEKKAQESKQPAVEENTEQAEATDSAEKLRKLKETLIKKKYEIPSSELLAGPRSAERPVIINPEDDPKAQKLIATLESFGVGAKIIGVMRGPAVTRYELQPNPGVKVSRIVSLSDDIALNLASTGVRIEAPIPGKEAVGIEVPNSQVEIVALRQVIESDEFKASQSPLAVALGRDIAGKNIVADIAKMPHLLIAGATGSGKSVCINTIVASVLYKAGPEDVRMIMIDPKIVELGVYNGIPHLLVPVVTNPKKAAGALSWAVAEMENRYTVFSENNVRDIKAYNTIAERNKKLTKMPQILIIIDELADLMMVAAKEIEDSIIRLAQKARAAGLHIIIATQRPSVDVITGLIKANIPSRIAFAVTSQIDSRTILDGGGAEKLLGRGDMLFHPIGMSKPLRVQGAFVSDSEIEALADSVRSNYGMALYSDEIQSSIDQKDKDKDKDKSQGGGSTGDGEDDGDADVEMIDAAAQLAIEYKQLSTSFLQRKLRLGYSRASRIVDTLEAEGLISEADGSKPRQLLMTKEEWEKHIAEVRGA